MANPAERWEAYPAITRRGRRLFGSGSAELYRLEDMARVVTAEWLDTNP